MQNELFDVGADLANPVTDTPPPYPPLRIDEAYITRLESDCDSYNAGLPTLRSFLLPGGSPGATLLHMARTVTRRAERSAWAAVGEHGDSVSPLPARYLNRLSDLLFILARQANAGHDDVLWKPGGERGGADTGRADADLQGYAQVGAGRCGLEPGEQAGEGRLAHGQLDGPARPGVPAGPGLSLSWPSRHSTTIMPGPRLAASPSVGRRRDTTVRSRRGNTTSGRIDRPRAPNQQSSSRW